jgi:Family of unknown function (DUF6325)
MAASVEYVIIGFSDNEFRGEIAPELAALIDAGLVRIVDLIFVSKGVDGSVVTLEVDEDDELAMFAALDGEVGGIIGPDDIEHAAAAIEGGDSVLLIVWENLWAAPFAAAVERAGGVLIEGAKIPVELIEEAEALAEAG